ncbi:MAG: Hsp33 family molecular chaperone HslO [Turneriella sp.]|nr:Hsp33 family molecular chaperone HslO [Turneriella sp.]
MVGERARRLSFHTRDADFRAIFADATEPIHVALEQIDVPLPLLYPFCELTVCANLLAGLFHDLQDITLRLETPRFVRHLIAEASPEGIFRGTAVAKEDLINVRNPMEVEEDIAHGLLQVTKRFAYTAQPVQGTVGNAPSIAHLVQQYLSQSEQIQTTLLIGVQLAPGSHGKVHVVSCMALLIEALPDVSEHKKFIVLDNIARLKSLSEFVGHSGEERDVMDLLDSIYPGEQWIASAETPLVYRCRCHRDGYLQRVAEMARRDWHAVFGDDYEIEVRCGYCRNTFRFHETEVAAAMRSLFKEP